MSGCQALLERIRRGFNGNEECDESFAQTAGEGTNLSQQGVTEVTAAIRGPRRRNAFFDIQCVAVLPRSTILV